VALNNWVRPNNALTWTSLARSEGLEPPTF
jgi:hypothetical protein